MDLEDARRLQMGTAIIEASGAGSGVLMAMYDRLELWCKHQFWMAYGVGGGVALTLVGPGAWIGAGVYFIMALLSMLFWVRRSRAVRKKIRTAKAVFDAKHEQVEAHARDARPPVDL